MGCCKRGQQKLKESLEIFWFGLKPKGLRSLLLSVPRMGNVLGWASEMAQWVRVIAAKAGELSYFPELTGRKQRTNFCKLSPDLHMRAMVQTPTYHTLNK